MTKLIIPIETFSLNKWYSGQHYRIRSKTAKEWHLIVKNEVDKQKIKPITEFPVRITTQSFYKKRGRVNDTLNTVTANKLIEDGLVGAGILPDDTVKYVSEHLVLEPQFNTGEDKVIVTIKERKRK